MNIIEKLKLQQTLGGILLFKEGVFLRAYNESCYILTQLLQHKLKTTSYQVKCLNQLVVSSAFPERKLSERLPNAVLTEFGAKLAGDFDLSGYKVWFYNRCHHANEVSRGAPAREKEAQASATRATRVVHVEKSTRFKLSLSPQQLSYLSNWQKGAYPIEVDLGFIESLKRGVKNV